MTAVAHVVINVKALVPAEDLDSDDTAVAGVYSFSFLESEVSPLTEEQKSDGLDPIEEHALDLFHDKIGISVLDDFEIVAARVQSEDDIPEDTDHEDSVAVMSTRWNPAER